MNWENYISIYAAVIATIALMWNIIDARRKEKPEFVIKCGYKIVRSNERGAYYFNSFRVRVTNIKDIPRKVKIFGIEYFNNTPDAVGRLEMKFYDKFKNKMEYSDILHNSDEHLFEIDDTMLVWLRPENIGRFRIVLIDNSGKKHRSSLYSSIPMNEENYIQELDSTLLP